MTCKLCFNRYQGNVCPKCGLFSYERAIAPTLNFGKHNGLTIEQVYEQNPDYLKWMLERKAGTPAQRAKARLLLKIPPALELDSSNPIPKSKPAITDTGNNAHPPKPPRPLDNIAASSSTPDANFGKRYQPHEDNTEVDIAFLLASTESFIHNRNNNTPAYPTQTELNLPQPYQPGASSADRNSGFSQPNQHIRPIRPSVAGNRASYAQAGTGLDRRSGHSSPETLEIAKKESLWKWLLIFIFRLLFGLALLLVVIGIVAVVSNAITKNGSNSANLSPFELSKRGELTNEASGCTIKGNVSIDTDEKIYHLPGQRYYANTKIDSRFGERWFCSEADAINNGWRKSRE